MRKLGILILTPFRFIGWIDSLIKILEKWQAAVDTRNEKRKDKEAEEYAIYYFKKFAERILEKYERFENSEYWFVEFLKIPGEYTLKGDDHIYAIELDRGFVIEITYMGLLMESERYGNSYSRMDVCGYKLTNVILRKGDQGYARIPSFKKQWIEYKMFTIG